MESAPLALGGIVLCGGRSTRMGRAKEWLPIGGELLLQRVVRMVSAVVKPVVVAARPGQELPPLPGDVAVVYDALEDFGPLAGIAAGMEALAGMQCHAAVVASCDHPLLQSEVVSLLVGALGGQPAVIVCDGPQPYPLLGVYRLSTRALLADVIRRGEHRAREFARLCAAGFVTGDQLRQIDPRLLSLCNVNDARAYADALGEI